MTGSFDQIRIDLVNAMWKADGCEVSLCTAPGCGHIDIERLFPQLGIEHDGRDGSGARYKYLDSLEPELIDDQFDALFMLNVLMRDGSLSRDHILEGMMEVPQPVGDLLWEQGWNARLMEAMNASPWIREATSREFVLELTKIAFSDEFLASLPMNRVVDEVIIGVEALKDMSEKFASGSLALPIVPEKLVENLRVVKDDWAWNSGSPWNSMACYMLDVAIPTESEGDRGYFEVQIPKDYIKKDRGDYWMCAHRGHGMNSYGLGIVAQFGGIFIAQQTGYGGVYMSSDDKEVSKHMKAYNRYIAPLEKFNSSLNTSVLFSDYRGYAAIFTTERRAIEKVVQDDVWPVWQLPDGWGIAATREGGGRGDSEFRARLKEIVDSNYSPQLTASAQFLLKVVTWRD